MKILENLKTHQQSIILLAGYILVAGIAFNLGRATTSPQKAPDIKIEQAFAPINHTPDNNSNQLITGNDSSKPGPNQVSGCQTGQIKGNISSSGDRVYHLPGGSFYNRTVAEQCFASEQEAQAAGFRKSKN